MRERTCCFTGHRTLPKEHFGDLLQKTLNTIEQLIEQGYVCFKAGGALGFDTMCALAVLMLKLKHPHIRLHLVLPFPQQADRWKPKEQERYEKIKQQADQITYGSPYYTSDCFHKRNRQLVDNSSVCICYLTKPTGGTAYTVAYAGNQGLKIYNIANL